MPSKKNTWGGKRPGAGAPRGNLNALTHGRRSFYMQALGQALAEHPTTREALIRLARRRRAQHRQAERMAATILRALLERTLMALKDDQDDRDAADTNRVLNAILQRNNQDSDAEGADQSSVSGGWPE